MDQLRMALVGTGKIAVQSHLAAVQSLPGVELTAVVDTSLPRAQEVVKRYGLNARCATDVSAVLDDFDAAIICTPNHTHASIAGTCLSAGKHVLIEKPMTTTVEDAEMICGLAAENNCIAAAGYFLRFNPDAARVKRLVETKQFGEVKRFIYRHGTRGGWSPLSSYTLDRNSVGGGSLVVLGTHLIDLAVHWFGYPDRVTLHDDAHGDGAEAQASARFHYDSGLEGEVLVSKTVNLPEGCAIEFEQGVLLVRSRGEGRLVFRPSNDADLEYRLEDREKADQAPDLFKWQLQDFIAACQSGKRPAVPAEEGLMNVRLIDQLYQNRVPIDEDWYAAEQYETELRA